MKPLIISAPSSGCGKTTVTLGLLAALRRRGVRVAPFKVGPDFIDPGHHAAACGRVSRNLDGWMCGEAWVRGAFARGCAGAEVAVVEGVMGLFDGASGASDVGSSAEIARWLGGQAVLVVDARAQARSAAALVQGFAGFEPRLEFAGVIFNRVGSPGHAEMLREAVASVPGLPPVLGCLPRAEDLAMPERHLGLVTAGEGAVDAEFFARVADWVEAGVDLDALLALPGVRASENGAQKVTFQDLTPGSGRRVRIGVGRDAAFCFYYPDNLELLEQAGAELVFFSPLGDGRLPVDLDGLYLGGGYPELHTASLAANRALLEEIRRAAENGLPVYAECGGFMALARGIDGVAMAGIFPAEARMLPRRRALGYREVSLTADSPLGPTGTVARGHEFHYSEMALPPEVERVYRMTRRAGVDAGEEGYRIGNTLGSYVHLHFGSNPQLARNFVEFCRHAKG
ncbi:cobyrinate a,c-diamide synthase [Desulfuromonas versatilis]|uniref:Cobyrinate a,c-diamide synthase n=1 Tax=Desulfuromonas versatilis TaxID=2802975 RepID=A0ABN6DUG0_9BACT|nr:cobyrinate a,c-diamide synthase [Desulfuromonas versatilis]BCR03735.1 cobyrinate a,c-diamide synthase [Desulfuromonas versatilis]